MTADKPPKRQAIDRATRIHRWVTLTLVIVMSGELIVAIMERQRMTSFLISAIILIIVAPTFIGRRLRVKIPAEFQVLTVLFVFAALFLGEIRSYYSRVWWWDIALHTSSGLLLGILGFLLVYVLNESDTIDMHLKPRFVAMFAFLFAVTIGALWEIFEFGMDRLVGTTMQKPMLGDPSGLTDTMWDLIVDTLGALVISVFGWWYMKLHKRSFIEVWIDKFFQRNPHLFLK